MKTIYILILPILLLSCSKKPNVVDAFKAQEATLKVKVDAFIKKNNHKIPNQFSGRPNYIVTKYKGPLLGKEMSLMYEAYVENHEDIRLDVEFTVEKDKIKTNRLIDIENMDKYLDLLSRKGLIKTNKEENRTRESR